MVAGAWERGRRADAGSGGALFRLAAAAAAAQEGRTFLWWPVALLGGIGIYFALPAEPSAVLALAAALAGLAVMAFGRAVPLAVLAGIVALGFALAKLRSEAVATPLLRATTPEVALTGRVVSADLVARRRYAIVLAPDAIEGLAADRVPVRLRLSSPAGFGAPPVGARIAARARLAPLPAPIEPGGFDYGRQLWFGSVGGTGRVTSAIAVIDPRVPWRWWLDRTIGGVRDTIGARIHAVLAEPYASFAEALITGERATIPRSINRSLLVSGLFHILSISGLHMWLVAGGVFWSVRAALALSPALALRYPIKKWAAAAALLMGLFYMLLAEGGVATQRSFIMIAVVFFAVIVDRPALSARNLALAALLVLVFEPEAAVQPSFQMSFLAVLGLVSFYEAWSGWAAGRDPRRSEPRWWRRLLAWAGTALVASLLTSLVAGAASSIPAAYHFGRLSPYGVLANGLAVPVVGLVVMPAALLAALLMPLGLEALPLSVMGKGLELVVAISDRIAALPGADTVAARPPALAMLTIAAGAVVLCLLKGWARLSGIGLVAAGLALAVAPPHPPDILIERNGQNVAIRNAAGELVPAYSRRTRFTVEKWLQANGEEATPAEAARRPGWTCAAGRCTAAVAGRSILYVSHSEGKPLDCAAADIVIADYPLRGACSGAALRIDRFDLWRGGASAIRLAPGAIAVETARQAQGRRPWVVVPERRTTPFVPRQPRVTLSAD